MFVRILFKISKLLSAGVTRVFCSGTGGLPTSHTFWFNSISSVNVSWGAPVDFVNRQAADKYHLLLNNLKVDEFNTDQTSEFLSPSSLSSQISSITFSHFFPEFDAIMDDIELCTDSTVTILPVREDPSFQAKSVSFSIRSCNAISFSN